MSGYYIWITPSKYMHHLSLIYPSSNKLPVVDKLPIVDIFLVTKKSTIGSFDCIGSKNAWFHFLKNLAHSDQFWNLADIKIWSNGPNFSKIEIKHFCTLFTSLFWFLKILTKIWPSLAKIWPKIWSNLVKMVMWHNLLMSITRIQNFSLKFCLV